MKQRRLLGSLLAAACCGVASADRLHLDGGGTIEVESWWIEGDLLVYRKADGTVGLPRSSVARIEAGQVRDPALRRQAPAAPRPPTPAAPPRPPGAQLGRANEALLARDYESAAEQFQSLMAQPTHDGVEARVGYALTQIALGEDGRALAVVLDGLVLNPRHAGLLELLGDLRDREERVDDALRAWREAFRESPSDRVLAKIHKGERELSAGRSYDLETSAHFNLSHAGDVAPERIDDLLVYLEEQYLVLADALDHAPRQPITVVLYPAQQFREVTEADDWVGALYDGKIRLSMPRPGALDPASRDLVRHELTHAFVQTKTRGNCPRWLHEGLAQRFEGRSLGPREREEVLLRLRGAEATLWDRPPLSYPAALSLTTHLEGRRGLDGLVRTLDHLGRGDSLDAALTAVYGAPYPALCRDWAAAVLDEGLR